MTRSLAHLSRSFAVGAASLVASAVALADTTAPLASARVSQIFDYKVTHALYGDIGTYRNVIERTGDTVAVHSTLDLAVRFLGFSVYRETGQRFERWRGDRLVEFRSTTHKNGSTIEVTGEARDDVFVINGPWGRAEAPKDVRPSNPWSAKMLNASLMMSTTTGLLSRARVTGGHEGLVTLHGQPRKLRQFEVVTDKQEFLWLDEGDIPVAFGTEDNGSRVEFILTRITQGGDATTVRADKLPPATTTANDP